MATYFSRQSRVLAVAGNRSTRRATLIDSRPTAAHARKQLGSLPADRDRLQFNKKMQFDRVLRVCRSTWTPPASVDFYCWTMWTLGVAQSPSSLVATAPAPTPFVCLISRIFSVN